MNIFITLVLIAIIISLGFAMYYLMNDNGSKKRTVNALIVRVSLSAGLIAFLVIGYLMGWIQPHGIQP
ncbi:MAG: twin transmembrane helix small protein [Oceanococcus sp.]